VRMVLARELPVRLLDLFFGGGLRHAEGGVIILEVHIRWGSAPYPGSLLVGPRRPTRCLAARSRALCSGRRFCALVESENPAERVEFLRDAPARVARRERLVFDERPEPLHDLGDREQALHAREIDPGFVDEALDDPQPLQLLAR